MSVRIKNLCWVTTSHARYECLVCDMRRGCYASAFTNPQRSLLGFEEECYHYYLCEDRLFHKHLLKVFSTYMIEPTWKDWNSGSKIKDFVVSDFKLISWVCFST